jgi:hypothetical protein
MRIGDDVYKIRTYKVHDGVAASRALIDAHQRLYKAKQIKHKPMRTTLAFCDMKAKRVNQSQVLRWVSLVLEIEPDLQPHLDMLHSLTFSETYALDFALTSGLEKPAQFDTTKQ